LSFSTGSFFNFSGQILLTATGMSRRFFFRLSSSPSLCALSLSLSFCVFDSTELLPALSLPSLLSLFLYLYLSFFLPSFLHFFTDSYASFELKSSRLSGMITASILTRIS
jgi:hypothetical protein